MTYRHLLFAALPLAFLTSPVLAGSWTLEGSNGGSAQGTHSCARQDGKLVCDSASTVTGAKGRVTDRQRQAVMDRSGGTVSGRMDSSDGRSRDWSGSWKR